MVSQQPSAPVAIASPGDASPADASPADASPGDASPADARPSAVPGAVKALKVSASSRPTLVAGAIAGMVRERGRAEVQAIGAAAINQAVKAVAIARGYMAPAGVDLVCIPGFIDVIVDTQSRTAIRFLVEPR